MKGWLRTKRELPDHPTGSETSYSTIRYYVNDLRHNAQKASAIEVRCKISLSKDSASFNHSLL